jgi:hypothetical protein
MKGGGVWNGRSDLFWKSNITKLYTWYILNVLLDLYVLIVITHFTHELPCFLCDPSIGSSKEKLYSPCRKVQRNEKHRYYREHILELPGVQSAGWLDIHFTVVISCERAASLAEKNSAARHHVLRRLINLHNEHPICIFCKFNKNIWTIILFVPLYYCEISKHFWKAKTGIEWI